MLDCILPPVLEKPLRSWYVKFPTMQHRSLDIGLLNFYLSGPLQGVLICRWWGEEGGAWLDLHSAQTTLSNDIKKHVNCWTNCLQTHGEYVEKWYICNLPELSLLIWSNNCRCFSSNSVQKILNSIFSKNILFIAWVCPYFSLQEFMLWYRISVWVSISFTGFCFVLL